MMACFRDVAYVMYIRYSIKIIYVFVCIEMVLKVCNVFSQ